MEEGWVKLYRKFLDWEWHTSPETVSLLLHLILMANHEDKKWEGITIKRGQLVTTRDNLSETTGLSVQTIRTCINRLKSTNEITSTSTNKYTIITISNYDRYQAREDCNQPALQPALQPTTNQQLTNNNKNVRNILYSTQENAPAYAREDWRFISSVRRSVLGNDPDKIAEYKKEIFRKEVSALAEKVGMDRQQQEDFVSWWTERSPGQEKIRAEFEVAFDMESRMRSWMKREKPRSRQVTTQPKSRMDQFEENMKFINDFFDGQYTTSNPDEQ